MSRHYWTKLTPAISDGTFWPLRQELGPEGELRHNIRLGMNVSGLNFVQLCRAWSNFKQKRSKLLTSPCSRSAKCFINWLKNVFFLVSIHDSLFFQSRNLGDCIDIFSTLVGQKKSLGRLQEHLSKNKEVKHWVVNQFCQGKTMRWCLAWTYKVGSVRSRNASLLWNYSWQGSFKTLVNKSSILSGWV